MATQNQNGQQPNGQDGQLPSGGAYSPPPDWTPAQQPPQAPAPQPPAQAPQPDQSGSPTPTSAQLGAPPAAPSQGFQAPAKDKPVSGDGQTVSGQMWGKPNQEFTAPQSDQEVTDSSGPFVSPEKPLPPTDDELQKLDTPGLINRLTNYSDVDSGQAASVLHDRLQADAANSTPAQGAQMLANDFSNTLSKVSLNPVDWAKGLNDFKNQLGGGANTVLQALGVQNTLTYRDDLSNQLKQGTITSDQYSQGTQLLDQIDNMRSSQVLRGGMGMGENPQKAQQIQNENSEISRLFFQADPSFARSAASKAMLETLTGTEHSLQSIAAIPQQISDFDPTKYFTGHSKMTNWSPDDLKDWINTERTFNVQRQEHAAGQVDPWTQAFASWSNNFLKRAGLAPQYAETLSPEDLAAEGRPVSPEKIGQVSTLASTLEASALGRILPLGEIGGAFSDVGLKAGGLAAQAVPQAARLGSKLLSSRIGQFVTNPILMALHYPELAHGDIGPLAWDGAKELATYGALRVLDKFGPLTADMFERAAENNYAGGGFLAQGVSRGLRLGADAVTNSFPYALLTSGGDPGQFWSNLTSLSALHGALGAPGAAAGTAAGGLGDWIFARDGNVKQVPPRAYHVDPGLDSESIANINNLDPHLKNIVTRTQDAAGDHTDVYVVSPQTMQDYQQRFGATGQQTPRGLWVPPEYTGTGRSASFVDVNHVGEALAHEAMGHPLYWLMNNDARDQVEQAAVKENDPNQFVRDNYGQNQDYDSLPDNPSKANPDQLNKALIRREMAVEAIGQYWNGGSIEQFYKNKPGLARSLRYGTGSILERLGIPTKTWESETTMGINPAFAPATLIDGYYRDLLNHRIVRPNSNTTGSWPQQGGGGGAGGAGVPPTGGGGGAGGAGGLETAKPANVLGVSGGPDESVIKGLMKQGFNRQQATDFAAKGTVSPTQGQGRLTAPTPGPVSPTTGPSVPDIEQRAYQIAQQREAQGTPGDQLSDWHQAEAELKAAPTNQPEPPAPGTPIHDSEEYHGAVEDLARQGVPQGEARAAVEGRQPKSLRETGEAGIRLPVTPPGGPQGPAPAGGGGAAMPPGEQEQRQTPPETPSAFMPEPPPAPGLPQPKGGAPAPVVEHPARDQRQNETPPSEEHPVQEHTPASGHKLVGVIGSEFGEVDNPERGGYTEPNWNVGKWGDRIDGENNHGVALPPSILRHLGYTGQKNYGQEFNSKYEVRVHNPKTGATSTASLKDIGPGASTGASIDMLWGTRKDLGFDTNFKGGVNFEVVDKKTGQTVYAPTGHEVAEGGGGHGGSGAPAGFMGMAGVGGEPGAFSGWGANQPPAALGSKGGDIEEAERIGAPYGGGGEGGGGGGGGTFQAPPAAPGRFSEAAQPMSQAMQMAEFTGTYGGGYGQGGYGGTIPGIQPMEAPGISFMPGRRKMGGIEPEGEGGEPGEQSTLGEPNVKGFSDLIPHLGQGIEGIKRAQKMHAQLLSPDDTRVKKQADNMFKGEHFVQGDPVHTAALANTPLPERVALAAGQTAIANKQPMHISYASAPPDAAKESPVTRASREVNYDASSPQARLLGQTNARLAGHSFIPTALGVSLPRKKGAPNNGYIQGISTSVAAHNHHQLNQALSEMGEESPYPKLNSPKFRNDLSGYVQNLLAGHKGTGDAYMPGTEEFPSQPDKNYVPVRLKKKEADFLNAVINNQGARHSKAIQELARKGGTLLNEEGETNPIRHAIDARQAGLRGGGPEEIEDKGIKAAAQDRWSKGALEPTIRTFNTGLIHALHESPEHIPEEIRPKVPGYQELTQTLGRELGGPKGRPDIGLAAGFMPPALSKEEHAELTGNIRKQWLAGKIRTPEYIERIGEVPQPGEQMSGFMPMAGKRAVGFPQARKEGRTFETPLPGGGQRFEIDDRDMAFKPPSRPAIAAGARNALEERYNADKNGPGVMPLSDAVRHPDLFENYPWLRHTKISMDPTLPHYGHYEQPWLDREGNMRGDHLVLKNPTDKETLAHELQHAVQHYEKFAGKGTNSDYIYDRMYGDDGIWDELHKQWSAAYPERPNMSQSEYDRNQEERYGWTKRRMKEMAQAMYEMDPGEIEARVAGRRSIRTSPEEQQEALDEMFGEGRAPIKPFPETTPKEDVLEEMGRAATHGRIAGTMSGRPGVPQSPAYMPAKRQEFRPTSPEDFIAARNKSKRPQFLSPLEPEDITNHQLYTNKEGTAGAAVSPEGDIQNVFNNGGGKGAGQRALAHAIGNGGRTLDAYDPYLPSLYRQFGFKETGRMKFNRDYAPPNWNFEEDDDPDIAFMAHQGYPPGGEQAAVERASGPHENWLPNERSTQQETDWDQAKERSRGEVSRVAGEAPGPQALGAREESGDQAGGVGGGSVEPSFMPAAKRASAGVRKRIGERPSDEEQAKIYDRVAGRLQREVDGSKETVGAIPLRADRGKKGEFRTDSKGNPLYEKENYDLANAPILGKKALGFDEKGSVNKAPKGTVDKLDKNDLQYLNPTDRLRVSHLNESSAVNTFADKLSKMYESLKDIPEVMHGKDWYNETEGLLKKHFGGDADLVANLLAATSANTNVKVNYKLGMQAYHQHLRGDFDRHADLYNKAYDMKQKGQLAQHVLDNKLNGQDQLPKTEAEAMAHYIKHHDILPRQEHGPLFGMNSLPVLKVLAHTWHEEVGGPKTPNYAGNLSGKSLQATIDMWAARTMRRLGYEGQTKKPWRIQPAAETGVTNPDFGLSQLAFRKAAAQHGLEPRQLQAILWFAEQKHWQKHGWEEEIDPAERDYRPALKEYQQPEWAKKAA